MTAESATTLPALALEKCGAVVLDVAGTTTSINFIKGTLFPFVIKHAEEYLKANWDVNEVKEAVKELKDEELDIEKATKLLQQMTLDNEENKGLKTLQGMIYKKGYEDGELKAHVFEDVVSSLEMWSKSRKIAIYSTGSVEAQKLLFAHTEKGDLSASIHKYFDQTVIGSKIESTSYEKIIKDLEMSAEQLLFITDNAEEAEAAKTAGLQVAIVKREGNADLSEDVEKKFKIISSFSEISFEVEEDEGNGKRKIEEENVEAPPTKLAKTDEREKSETATEEKPVNEDKKEEEKMEVDGGCLSSEKKGEEKEPEKTEVEAEKVEETIPEKTDDKVAGKVEDSKEEKMDSTEATEKSEEEKKKTEEKVEVKEVEEKESKPEKEVEESKEKPVTEEKTADNEAEKVVSEDAANKTDKVEAEVKENGTEESAKKSEETEKENKSELANGVAAENGAAESSDVQEKVNGSNGNEESEATEEIKTKKIEAESTETEANTPAAVSVEV